MAQEQNSVLIIKATKGRRGELCESRTAWNWSWWVHEVLPILFYFRLRMKIVIIKGLKNDFDLLIVYYVISFHWFYWVILFHTVQNSKCYKRYTLYSPLPIILLLFLCTKIKRYSFTKGNTVYAFYFILYSFNHVAWQYFFSCQCTQGFSFSITAGRCPIT